MSNITPSCVLRTNTDKIWTHDQYYMGDSDKKKRRNGNGINHWTGAESLESYSGRFLRDTMHGNGEYRWRYRGTDGVFATYEGHFYGNNMHGYGDMSYQDGRVFTGLFHNNVRWGPGVERQACAREDVGLWRGPRLLRLAWRPPAPSVAVDLTLSVQGRACVERHRVLMATRSRKIGEFNSAIELLKQCEADPLLASEKWSKLYPKHCNDLASHLCNVDVFEKGYYDKRIKDLEEITSIPTYEALPDIRLDSEDSIAPTGVYYAWNNNKAMLHIMKHCFRHECQRPSSHLDLGMILNGPRTSYKRAGKHEIECRSLLMASYLGYVANVTELVNECNIHPDVSDIQGNNAIMYATCGDQPEIIHFLFEAGGNINSFNDCCCTSLGIALLRFACARKDISANGMIQALLPPPEVPPAPILENKSIEWHISRDIFTPATNATISKAVSKIAPKTSPSKKMRPSNEDIMAQRKKTDAAPKGIDYTDDNGDDVFTEEKHFYNNVNSEFSLRVNDLFLLPRVLNPVPYIFEVNNMVNEIDLSEEDTKKPPEKNPKKATSKVLKDTMKPSKEALWQSSKDEFGSMTSADKMKADMLAKMMLTILQLLSDGADPKLVKCPQPALFVAVVSGCSELVRHLINHGADANEVYPEILSYTALDIAVSQPLTYENLDIVRTLLECGARTDHRLKCIRPEADPVEPEILGPTLLHAVLVKKTDNDTEEEIRRQVLELLLQYNCDSIMRYKGRSSMDMAMTKSIDIFDLFIKCPRTDLNAVINDSNQTVLVKMFTFEFSKTVPSTELLQTLTNLLLFGADPLLECQNLDNKYKNMFVYARKILFDLENLAKPMSPDSKGDAKGKKVEKPKKDDKLMAKSSGKIASDSVGDYRQALDLVVECARILLVRWLQAKLFKELLKVVKKNRHRHWNMILPEHKHKKTCGLWLTSLRCIEIWNILKATKRKIFSDHRILKLLLCIVQFYCRRAFINFNMKRRITAEEKATVESEVRYILYEHKMAEALTSDEVAWSRPYVMPELAVDDGEKYNVCFECLLPFGEDKILCIWCKAISFCSLECLKINIERAGCHPCSENLRLKYFPSPIESMVQDAPDSILL